MKKCLLPLFLLLATPAVAAPDLVCSVELHNGNVAKWAFEQTAPDEMTELAFDKNDSTLLHSEQTRPVWVMGSAPYGRKTLTYVPSPGNRLVIGNGWAQLQRDGQVLGEGECKGFAPPPRRRTRVSPLPERF